MSDPEDYTAVFFQECDELLDDLEAHLAKLEEGADDPEIVNAAFRAVHSIKGGADAFGFRDLVGFAHVYEATMDAIRGGRLAVSQEVCEILIRGRDILCDLVEGARGGASEPLPAAASMIEELTAVTGGKPAAPRVSAPAEAPTADPAPAQTKPIEPLAPPAKAGPEPDFADLDVTYQIRLSPGADFLTSGHDPLRLIQALRKLGAARVRAKGEIPPLPELDPGVCPLSWEIELTADCGPAAVEDFFRIYRSSAEIEITAEAEEEVPTLAEPPAGSETNSGAGTGAEGTGPVGNAAAPATGTLPGGSPGRGAPSADRPAEKATAPPGAPVGDSAGAKAGRTLRVDLERVDRLVNMVGEIVITQAALAQTLSDQGVTNLELGHAIDAMSRQIRDLQESVMAIRAQPVKGVFSRMSRLVRDLAQTLHKEARAEIAGEQTEVDTTVIEELAEPLIHMVRNAMDHGLEDPETRERAGKPRQGVITISAEHRGERVIIAIADDGRGINRERVLAKAVERGVVDANTQLSLEEIDQLIFHPGLSTSESVSNVSGRGVGMDVVKRNIAALGGRVTLENCPGKGTRITIALPLSLAVLDGMTIAVGGQHFVIPLGAVVEALTLDGASPRTLPSGARVMVRRDQYLPLLSLRKALGIGAAPCGEQLVVVVDADADARMGLLVDELVGQRQVVLKSLETNYHGVPGVSGATILSDGRAALILDVAALRLLASPDAPIFKPDTASLEYMQ